jgi:cephalosporin hydroxylase
MTDPDRFLEENRAQIAAMRADPALTGLSNIWMREVARYRYSYHFSWLGLPVIQVPQDLIALQEIVWSVKPELIVETGIARGGSLVFFASLLELLGGPGRVVGVDIEIRPHNRRAIEGHPLFKRITLIEGSSVAAKTARQVCALARSSRSVLVVLDSNHTRAHVARELELYSPLVTRGSYLVVLDTVIEDVPADFFPERPWKKGNSPKTAVHEFLRTHDRFVIDKDLEAKLLITVAPDGYLRCVKE